MSFPLADSLKADFGSNCARDFVSGLTSEGRDGSGMGAIAPARSADSLPCQFSNNSTELPSKLSSYQRKNAFSINENLGFVVERFGLGKIGFLTLTFPKDLSLKEGNRRLNSLATHVLNKLFECWVCIREFTKGGRPHFHLIVVCREDIREGFNFENFTRLAFLTSRPERRRKNAAEIRTLSRALSPSPALKGLWAELRRVLPLYQFGRHELAPIRKSGAALARYVGGYVRKSMDFRPIAAKGARLITYSKTFPRKIVGHEWSFNCDGTESWRAKVAEFAKLHRVRDLDEMKSRFGPRWAWWFRDVISSINLLPVINAREDHGDRAGAVSRYVNGSDNEDFSAAVESGNMQQLHLRRPRLPEVNGVIFEPTPELRPIFDFHLEHWFRTRAQIAVERSAGALRAMGGLRKHSAENLVRARASVVFRHPLSARGGQAERSRNFSRLVHPEYHADHYPSYET